LKILHVTASYAPAYRYGGPIQNLEALVRGLHGLGVDQRVLTTDADGAATLQVGPGWQRRDGVPTRYLHRWFGEEIAPAMLQEAFRAARHVDLVHVTSVFCVSSALGLLAGLATGRPVVLSTRGALQPVALKTGRVRKRAWLAGLGAAYRRVKLFHATAEHEAAAIRRAFGTGSQIVIIPNGTQVPEVDELEELRRVATSGDPPVIGMLGRIHPIKAIDRVIEALGSLQQEGVGARLVVAGPPQDLSHLAGLEAQVARLGLNQRVTFLPALSGREKQLFLAGCRVVVVASHSENFSNVVVEALALEVPVVASLGTPWAELPRLGCGNWVQNDSRSLATALRPYLTSLEVARTAGIRGRQRVLEKYTCAAVAQQMFAAYNQVLGAQQ
jgi:glycosyltransferase involved in cell wall biosynthesis